MYHAETNTPASARTSNLNEELGQVAIRTCRILLLLIPAEICCLYDIYISALLFVIDLSLEYYTVIPFSLLLQLLWYLSGGIHIF